MFQFRDCYPAGSSEDRLGAPLSWRPFLALPAIVAVYHRKARRLGPEC